MGVGYCKTQNYTVYFYPRSIVICTDLQCFRITTKNLTKVYIDDLTLKLSRGEISSLQDLLDYNGELQWVNTTRPSLPF